MVFAMFGRWGEATPIWTVSLAVACIWLIACGMLRLARFQHEVGGYVPFFHGLSSPANAMFVLSTAGMIWLQPSSGFGPDVTSWNCGFCFGEGERPYLDFIILPILILSGGLMISDRKMSKLKSGIPMKLSIIQMIAILAAVIHAMSYTERTDVAADLSNTGLTLLMFGVSLFLVLVYIIAGPRLIIDDQLKEGD